MVIWTIEQVEFLEKNSSKMENRDIAKILNIPEQVVRNKRRRLKLKAKDEEDLTGKQFQYLTVLSLRNKRICGNRAWNCLCKCGNILIVTTAKLKIGSTKSCGCLKLEKLRSPPGDASWGKLFSRHKWNSKYLNRINNLDIEIFKKLCSSVCTYCDKDPIPWNCYLNNDGTVTDHKILKEAIDRSWINVNGIDRIDSNIGYVIENSIPCCTECNFMKSDMNFWKWISHIGRFNSGFEEKIINKLIILKKKLPIKI